MLNILWSSHLAIFLESLASVYAYIYQNFLFIIMALSYCLVSSHFWPGTYFSTSCRAGLLSVILFNFCFAWGCFHFFFILKLKIVLLNIVFLDNVFFSFLLKKILFFLASMFSDKKSAINFIEDTVKGNYFCLTAFKIYLFIYFCPWLSTNWL